MLLPLCPGHRGQLLRPRYPEVQRSPSHPRLSRILPKILLLRLLERFGQTDFIVTVYSLTIFARIAILTIRRPLRTRVEGEAGARGIVED